MPSMTGDWDNAPPSQRDGTPWPSDKVWTAVPADSRVSQSVRWTASPSPSETPAQLMNRLQREVNARISNDTHSVSVLSELPSDARYWGIGTRSMTYDSGYGRDGRSDMQTERLLTITWFGSDEALEAWVLKRVEARESYKVFRAEPVNTQVKAVFSTQK